VKRSLIVALLGMFIFLMVASSGCRGHVKQAQETMPQGTIETTVPTQEMAEVQPAETEETVVVDSTAQPVPEEVSEPIPMPTDIKTKNTQIQTALKNAGFYAGSIDGVAGPKTKSAIEEFQRAKGLTVDGKVGPKTWAELSKYLTKQ